MLKITEQYYTTMDCGKLARIDQWRYTCDACNQQIVKSDWCGRVWHWLTCKLIRDFCAVRASVSTLVFGKKVPPKKLYGTKVEWFPKQ
jgi:hypothetical protein